MTDVWNDPDFIEGDDYVHFDQVGDRVSGTIKSVRKHVWDDGTVCPKLFITTDEGEDKVLTAGQVRLKRELTGLRPSPGDHIVITLTDVEKRQGGRTLKHFSVEVTSQNRPVPGAPTVPGTPTVSRDVPLPNIPPAMPVAPAAAPVIDANAAAAAFAQLTQEQRVALGLPPF